MPNVTGERSRACLLFNGKQRGANAGTVGLCLSISKRVKSHVIRSPRPNNKR